MHSPSPQTHTVETHRIERLALPEPPAGRALLAADAARAAHTLLYAALWGPREPAGDLLLSVMAHQDDGAGWRAVHERVLAPRRGTPPEAPYRIDLRHASASAGAAWLLLCAWDTHAQLLASPDGATFAELKPYAEQGRAQQRFDALFETGGQVFATHSDPAATRPPRLFELLRLSPKSSRWRELPTPGLEATRGRARALAQMAGRLYLCLDDDRGGYAVWARVLDTEPAAASWQPVIDRGADRHAENHSCAAVCVRDDRLYLAAPRCRDPRDEDFGLAPPRPELIRLYADDSWDLIVGEPRFSRDGLKLPLSGLHAETEPGQCGAFEHLVDQGGLYVVEQREDSYGLLFSDDGELFERCYLGSALSTQDREPGIVRAALPGADRLTLLIDGGAAAGAGGEEEAI